MVSFIEAAHQKSFTSFHPILGFQNCNLVDDLTRGKNMEKSLTFEVLHVIILSLAALDPPEATFSGSEFLSYNLSSMSGRAMPIISTQDEISLHFRTSHPDGLLFHTGKE